MIATADLGMTWLIFLAAASLAAMYFLMKHNPEGEKEQEREDVIDEFRRIHNRVREKRPDLREPEKEPTVAEMRERIDEAVDKDASKAADTLKKMIDSQRRY